MADKSGLTVLKAELIALVVETLVFGSFSVFYGIAGWILLSRRGTQRQTSLNNTLFLCSTVMWLLSVTHLSLDARRAVIGFVNWNGVPQGGLQYLTRLNDPTYIAKTVVFVTMTILGDSFLTYRVWVVWCRAWWIALLPILLITGTAVGGYVTCHEFAQTVDSASLLSSNYQPWVLSFFSLSLATNVLCTLLISGRIIWSSRRVRAYRVGAMTTSPQWDVIQTLVESAAVYSAALASLLGVYVQGSNAQFIILDLLQPLIGLVFTLIIIRVGLGSAVDHGVGVKSETVGALSSSGANRAYPPRAVAITVSVEREQDGMSIDTLDNKDKNSAKEPSSPR